MTLCRTLHPLTGLLFASVIASGSADASTFRPITLEQRIVRSDLIVDASVTAVEHRISTPAAADERPLPHTFVTLQVHRVIKGAVDGHEITIRMIGGPDGHGQELELVGAPTFAPGDRDILFIRGNGDELCPIIGWESGRLRLVKGETYSYNGRELWLSPDGRFAFGPKRLDVEPDPHDHSGSACEDEQEAHAESFVPPAGSVRPDADGLGVALRLMTESLYARGAMPVPELTRSLDPDQPFHMVRIDVAATPAVEPATATPIPEEATDPAEAELIRAQADEQRSR